MRRTRLVRHAIALAIRSVRVAAVLIITLCGGGARVRGRRARRHTFIGCMAALIGTMVAFPRGVNLSIATLTRELEA